MDHDVISGTNPALLAGDDRREFLLRAGKLAVTAPAAAALLYAVSKSAAAQPTYTAPPSGGVNDGGSNPGNTDNGGTNNGGPIGGGIGGAKA